MFKVEKVLVFEERKKSYNSLLVVNDFNRQPRAVTIRIIVRASYDQYDDFMQSRLLVTPHLFVNVSVLRAFVK